MRVYVAVFALCAIAAIMTSQPNTRPQQKEQTPSTQSQPPVVASQDKSESGTHTNQANPSSPKWYTALERSDWWLVVIAALTGLAIVYQAREMMRATDAMKASTKLQEVSFHQWVMFERWETDVRGSPGERLLVITFNIVNPTDKSLTLDEVRVGVTGGEVFVSSHGHLLVPKSSYAVTFSHPVTEEDLDRRMTGLSLILTGSVRYTDVLKKKQKTTFTGILYSIGGRREADFVSQGIMVPEYVARQQKAN